MRVNDLITPTRIARCQDSTSKKRVLEQVSALLAEDAPDLTAVDIVDSLIGRERLGSTALGHGVAIPHGRMRGLRQPAGAFISLSQGIDFDAPDHQPVDLVFALIVPDESNQEHLQLLAQLAEMFSDMAFCRRLRDAQSSTELFELLKNWKSDRVPA